VVSAVCVAAGKLLGGVVAAGVGVPVKVLATGGAACLGAPGKTVAAGGADIAGVAGGVGLLTDTGGNIGAIFVGLLKGIPVSVGRSMGGGVTGDCTVSGGIYAGDGLLTEMGAGVEVNGASSVCICGGPSSIGAVPVGAP
jgi:hypothetical protein